MTVNTILTSERLATYEQGGTFVQWADVTNAVKLSFVTAWTFTPSMDEWDIDKIDTAAPIFTKTSDILGTYSFSLKNAVSLYDTALPSTDPLLLSTWIENIAIGQPSTIIFAPVMKAAPTNGSFPTNPFINLIFTGRIMSVPLDQVLDQGVPDVVISGDITDISQIRREATANNEG